MRGRPRQPPTPEQRADIERLGRRMGESAIVARTGYPRWIVLRVLGECRYRTRAREWQPEEDDLLRDHAGEMQPARLVKELAKLGYKRSERAVRDHIAVLLTLGARELRLELGVAQCALLTGRSERFIVDEIGRRRLRAHKSEGAWRVWPKSLREYVNGDLTARVNWVMCEHRELVDLLLRRWGVSDEERRASQRGRAG